MNLLDANILMYATFDVFPQHVKAKKWFDESLNNSNVTVGVPWETLLAFVRLASNPRVLSEPITVSTAWNLVRFWLSAPSTWIPGPTARHRAVLDELLDLPGMNSKLVADAHLAALAIEHGLVLCSADSDFKRFPHLQVENPTV
jgi:hypothetical protein